MIYPIYLLILILCVFSVKSERLKKSAEGLRLELVVSSPESKAPP